MYLKNNDIYQSKEDYLLHRAILLIKELIKTIDNDEYGEQLYKNNGAVFNRAIDFYRKHHEKFPEILEEEK